jgi:hypothetical protein
MSNTGFTTTPSLVNPSAVQSPYPNWLLNPLGSDYAAQMGYADTRLLAPAIEKMIVQSIPSQYKMLKLLFDKAPKLKTDEEHEWWERNIPRPALEVLVDSAGGATDTITLTAGGSGQVSINTQLELANGRQVIVTAVDTTLNTITVKPANGTAVLVASTAGDKIITGFAPIADGQNFFSNYTRMDLVRYTNFIARGLRAKRWTTMTALKYKNNQTVNYFEEDAAELMENVYNDLFFLFMNAEKGEYDITVPVGGGGTYKAKVGDGIFPFLVKNNAAHSSSSPATLEADLKALAFGTNYKNIDEARYILGTPYMLHLLSEVFKDPVRYAPNDTISKLDLQEYRFGGMKFVPVPIVHFEERFNQFQDGFARRLICIDPAKVFTTGIMGLPQIQARNTGSQHKDNGGYNDYIDYIVDYVLGTQVETVQGHFWIDMFGV